MNFGLTRLTFLILLMVHSGVALSADSYRYLHVSIDTPWAIFVFLLFIVLFPFVLSAILYWYFTIKKHKEEKEKQAESISTDVESAASETVAAKESVKEAPAEGNNS